MIRCCAFMILYSESLHKVAYNLADLSRLKANVASLCYEKVMVEAIYTTTPCIKANEGFERPQRRTNCQSGILEHLNVMTKSSITITPDGSNSSHQSEKP